MEVSSEWSSRSTLFVHRSPAVPPTAPTASVGARLGRDGSPSRSNDSPQGSCPRASDRVDRPFGPRERERSVPSMNQSKASAGLRPLRGGIGRSVLAASLVALLAGCPSTPVPPSPTPLPSSAATNADQLALDACDPSGEVPCIAPDAFVSVPIVGTGLALTYSSLWASSRADRPDWDPGSLRLGRWSVDAVGGSAPH